MMSDRQRALEHLRTLPTRREGERSEATGPSRKTPVIELTTEYPQVEVASEDE